MKQYEYKYIQWMPTKFNPNDPSESINILGQEGWELVTAFDIGVGQAIGHYLKREII